MTWYNDKELLEKSATLYYQKHKIHLRNKQHWFPRIAKHLLFFWSKKNRDRFVNDFAFTIGNYQFYPDSWSSEMIRRLLPHECQHTKQMLYLGLYIHPLLGLLPHAFLYALMFFPIKLAIFRLLFEANADYRQAEWLIKQKKIISKKNLSSIFANRAETVAGPMYFYTFFKEPTRKLYERLADRVWKKVMG